MRGRWGEFVRIAAVWTFALLFLDLVYYLIITVQEPEMSIHGWSGILARGAGAVSSAGFYLPAGVLIGAVGIASRKARLRPGVVAGAAVLTALFSFVTSGFVGPHLEYHARHLLVSQKMAPATVAESRRTSIPNDWALYRSITAERSEEARLAEDAEERREAVRQVNVAAAMLHQPIVLGLLAGLLLPLGLLVGRAGNAAVGMRKRLGLLGMTAGIVIVAYAGWVWAWMLLGPRVEPFIPLLYIATLAVPAAVLTTLLWAGTMADRIPGYPPISPAVSHPTS